MLWNILVIMMSMLYVLLSFVFPMILLFKQPFMVRSTLEIFQFSHSFLLVKYNKITQGVINQGQCARDVNLYTTDGQPTTLFSQITTGQPLIILAGSTS
jgi:hypothetical protein